MLNIEIKDLDEFLEKFGELDVNETLNTGIKKSTLFLEGEAIKETPVDKGFLHNSYETFFNNLQGKLVNTRSYGVAVHEGHTQTPGRFVPAIGVRLVQSFVKGNPFLTRTAEKSSDDVNQIMNNEVLKMLNSLKI